MLDPWEATVCSANYEAFLKARFRGDFDALMRWWQDHRNDAPVDQGPKP